MNNQVYLWTATGNSSDSKKCLEKTVKTEQECNSKCHSKWNESCIKISDCNINRSYVCDVVHSACYDRCTRNMEKDLDKCHNKN